MHSATALMGIINSLTPQGLFHQDWVDICGNIRKHSWADLKSALTDLWKATAAKFIAFITLLLLALVVPIYPLEIPNLGTFELLTADDLVLYIRASAASVLSNLWQI